jgi:ATP-dependent helicase/nuclease subunit B
MALVAALRDDDVPVRDVAVIVRDFDTYEQLIRRAGTQHGSRQRAGRNCA